MNLQIQNPGNFGVRTEAFQFLYNLIFGNNNIDVTFETNYNPETKSAQLIFVDWVKFVFKKKQYNHMLKIFFSLLFYHIKMNNFDVFFKYVNTLE